jgi:hypothetical protein
LKYIKTYDELLENLNVQEDSGEIKIYKNGSYKNGSYINFYKIDIEYLAEFNTNLNLRKLFETFGDEALFINKLFISKRENPFIIKRFIKKVEKYAEENDIKNIILIAEPFMDKRLNIERMIKLYEFFGFEIYQKLSQKSYLMFKNKSDILLEK